MLSSCSCSFCFLFFADLVLASYDPVDFHREVCGRGGGELEPEASDLGVYSPLDFPYSLVPWQIMMRSSLLLADLVVFVMVLDGFGCASFVQQSAVS
ncbi:unnamed protein product [Prunus armeniaca]|uniref:Secreted protein n=1 Tax=Prunus armeniaca TaxID=36596 RepID=A0A6J5W6Z5_PRUAR|nr:unnamed protein product [Prunus armeniaca]